MGCIPFASGLYWGVGRIVREEDNFGESAVESVDFVKYTRGRREKKIGAVDIRDGTAWDKGLSKVQLKTVEKVRDFIVDYRNKLCDRYAKEFGVERKDYGSFGKRTIKAI